MAVRGPHSTLRRLLQARNLKTAVRAMTPLAFEGLWDRLESFPVGERLLRGAFWSVTGTLVSRACGLAAGILAARAVGKLVYGELGIIQSTAGMLGTLAGFGMSTTAAKFVAELRGKDPAKAGRIIALSSLLSWTISLVLAALLVFLAPWLCRHTLADPHLTGYLRISAPLLVLGGINGAQLGVLSGLEAFKSIARVNSLTGLLNFPLIVGGALLFGLTGIVCGMALAQAGGCLLNLRALRREARRYRIPISFSSCMGELPIIWRFSIPAVAAEIIISAVGWATATMLVRQPNGYSEMGAFSAANLWFNAAMWLPFMVNNVTLPLLAERLGAHDRANAVKLFKMSIKMNAVVVLPVVAVGSLVSPYIMMSYGKGFASAWPTLVAVLITAGLLSFGLPVGQLIAASGRMWLGCCLNFVWGGVFLAATPLALGWGWGAFGLASARLLAYSAHALLCLAYMVTFLLGGKRGRDAAKADALPAQGCGSRTDFIG